MNSSNPAPGWPGIPARWTSSAKTGIGTALSARSRVWFTTSHGILNEIYYPRIDQACTRDFGLIVTNGRDFFSEEKRDTLSTIRQIAPGVPAFAITSVCTRHRYRLGKLILSDPRRDVVLQRIQFDPLKGKVSDYRLFALLSPHLVNRGAGNTAWIGEYKGEPMLFAEGGGTALAVACSVGYLARSAGFVGTSDGWQDLAKHFHLEWQYDVAANGNVALTAEIDIDTGADSIVLALGFGRSAEEAALRVRTSLSEGVDAAADQYIAGWEAWQGTLRPLDRENDNGVHNPYRVSTTVLRAHEASSFPGGYIASLSVPWGFSKGDEDLGGYHLVWPRDLVQTAGGLIAAGASSEARQVIYYLQAIQEPDGHWPQNCWLDGTAYWGGIQMDECAFPVVLVDLARRTACISDQELQGFWPMIHRAAGYLVRNGPVTPQDRWEEDGGYSPFTLAVEIAALLAAADLADRFATPGEARFLRETADAWNDLIERWTYATGTSLAKQLGIDGYYVRITPAQPADPAASLAGLLPIKNRPFAQSEQKVADTVSPDALALVRFGLRAADDPRIRNTVKAIDALLKVELPTGPCWRRYNGDGYGEHENGRPFDGTGIGRLWPLLTGERAHYELAGGNRAGAISLLAALESFASDGHLLPEQVWDADDIPERELFRGRPSGSAMPLVWAHAEHIKLLRSLADGDVFDTAPQTRQRYQIDKIQSRHCVWRFNHKCRTLPIGHTLRVELTAPAIVHWTSDDWRAIHDSPTRHSGFGIHYIDLTTAQLAAGDSIIMTFRWPLDDRWEGTDYTVTVG